jgi:hypothetical protein
MESIHTILKVSDMRNTNMKVKDLKIETSLEHEEYVSKMSHIIIFLSGLGVGLFITLILMVI